MLPNRILLGFILCTKGSSKCFQELTRPKAARGFSPHGQLLVSPQLIPGYMGSLGAGRASSSSSRTTRLPPDWNCDTQLLSSSGDTTGRSEHHTGGKGCVPGGKAHEDTAEPGLEGSNCRSTRKLLVWPQTSHGVFSISVYSSKERIK